ncbi:hypothetical protein TNCV_850711 [Trichonephila clavipes]|nr:hypothetical protein TNCV_850711 [Trichonephila clavipes]
MHVASCENFWRDSGDDRVSNPAETPEARTEVQGLEEQNDHNSGRKLKWFATLTAVPWALGSNPGEDMDVCKCIAPSRHRGTINSCRAASPLVRMVEEDER